MLVVVGLVHRVSVLAVQIVDMVLVIDDLMTAVGLVDMHVCAVRQVQLARGLVATGQLVDVVGTGTVDVAVVEEVDVVVVWDRSVAAPAVVSMLVTVDRQVRRVAVDSSGRTVVHRQDGSRAASVCAKPLVGG